MLIQTIELYGFVRLLLFPPIAYAALPIIRRWSLSNSVTFWKCCFSVFIACYLVETSLAITERVLEYNLFAWKASESEIDFVSSDIRVFRSASLYAHPLYNALMVSIAMSFILISPMKSFYKYALWGLGFVAILSFNTRGALIANTFLLLFYLIQLILRNKKGISTNVFFIAVLVGIILYLFEVIGFGHRLIDLGIFDNRGSTQARIDVLFIFEDLTLQDILWGISSSQRHSLLWIHQFVAIENFWIDLVLRMGLLLFSILVVLYYIVIKLILSSYSHYNALYVAIAFLGIASINNSLASNSLALYYFLFLTSVFDPRVSIFSIPNKLHEEYYSERTKL